MLVDQRLHHAQGPRPRPPEARQLLDQRRALPGHADHQGVLHEAQQVVQVRAGRAVHDHPRQLLGDHRLAPVRHGQVIPGAQRHEIFGGHGQRAAQVRAQVRAGVRARLGPAEGAVLGAVHADHGPLHPERLIVRPPRLQGTQVAVPFLHGPHVRFRPGQHRVRLPQACHVEHRAVLAVRGRQEGPQPVRVQLRDAADHGRPGHGGNDARGGRVRGVRHAPRYTSATRLTKPRRPSGGAGLSPEGGLRLRPDRT